MLQSVIPDFEEQRLQALRKLQLWKTPEEDSFDRITRLVNTYFNAAIVQINLVGEGTVWAKSSKGVFPREISRNESICAHTILENDVFCIPDLSADDRFQGSEYETEGQLIRFYVGIPLKVYGGFNVATLCVMDTVPRVLKSEEYEVLRDFADALQQQFSLSRLEQDGKFLVSQTSRLNTLLEALADGIVTIDSNGYIETANGSLARIFGYESSELVGTNFNELMPDLGRGGWDGYLSLLLNSEVPFQPTEKYSLQGKRKDGSLFPIEMDVREMFLEGNITYTGVLRDITARKIVEDEISDGRQTLEVTKENIPAGITVFDDEFKLKVVNKQVSRLLEIPDSLIEIGARFKDIVTFMFKRGDFGKWHKDREAAELDKVIKTLKSPRFIHIKAIDRYIEITSRMMPGGGFVSTYMDITTRLKNEEKLEALLRQANEANIAKTNFLSTISHEIRTPLNGVIGVAHMLEETDLVPKQKEMLETILHSGNTLLILINDVLDMNKIESGNLEIEHIFCDIYEIINSVKAPFEVQAASKNIGLVIDIEPDVEGAVNSDPTRIRQILINLLSNAIKFTEQGEVRVSLHQKERISETEQVVEIRVSDTGVGIAPARQKAIFDSFSQADNTINRRFGGSGLGLSIVRKLTDLMSGEISVESVEGVGTTFKVTLPIEIASANEVAMQDKKLSAAEVKEVKSLKVLVVEDNQVNAMITSAFLETLGHKSELVENGQLAVDLLTNEDFDLVLMDVHMPVMDGIEATKLIRLKQSSKTLPIIGVTAEAFADRHVFMKEIGMNDVLTKPFTKPQLKKVIEDYFEVGNVSSNTKEDAGSKYTAKRQRQRQADKDNIGMFEPLRNIPIGNDDKMADFIKQLGLDVTRSLIEKTPDAIRTELATMRQGLTTKDVSIVHRAAHTIAGVASSVCAERLAEQASVIEKNAVEIGDIEKVFDVLEKTAKETFAWWDAKMEPPS